MSIFAKKPDWEQKVMADVGAGPVAAEAPTKAAAGKTPGGAYGIADAIALLRGLPADQNGDLVVRVVRATLATLDVHLPTIIEDAARRQKGATERIAAVHGQMAELERQLENHRREIAALEADLKETTSVKERLQQAEKAASLSAGAPRASARTASGTTGQTPGPELLSKSEIVNLKD